MGSDARREPWPSARRDPARRFRRRGGRQTDRPRPAPRRRRRVRAGRAGQHGGGPGRRHVTAHRRPHAAVAAGCRRVWLVTTNDNAHAIAFYQRRGWDWVGFHRDAITEARRSLKPEIPERGEGGVPIRHEIELEILL